MPEYLAPGVFIQEVDSGPRPIEGVGTSTAAFIGFAPYALRRDINRPVLITSWAQFVEAFGKPRRNERGDVLDAPKDPHLPGAYLSYSVRGFFDNGGSRCYVICVMAPEVGDRYSSVVEIASTSSDGDKLLSVKALRPDADIEVAIEPGRDGSFTLKVREVGEEEWAEEFTDLSLAPTGAPPAPDVAPVPPAEGEAAADKPAPKTPRPPARPKPGLNLNSKLVEVTIKERATPSLDPTPRPGVYAVDVFQAQSGEVIPKEYIEGAPERYTGFEGLQLTDDVTIVCAPDLMSRLAYPNRETTDERVMGFQKKMVEHCFRMGDRVAILDTPPKLRAQEVRNWRQQFASYPDAVGKFAALYYPWAVVDGPDGRPLAVPPSGHIAGVYARTDRVRGVHKAPANEGVLGILKIASDVTRGEQEVLNPLGVNCVRSFPGRGTLIWGARTLSNDPAWRYINVRRLFNYVERSIERGLQWVVFEPNDPGLWARVKRDVSAFLTGCWRDGMLFGRAPDQAFYVKCDEDLNPEDSIARGLLVVEIGLAPVKPAEFVVFRFKQWAGGGA